MATKRFYGAIGFALTAVEADDGVFVEPIVERMLYGDVRRNTRQLLDGDKINNDLSVSNSISVVADEFANAHFHSIRYVNWAGALWTVSDVEVESPRLLLRLGGIYNGPQTSPAPTA